MICPDQPETSTNHQLLLPPNQPELTRGIASPKFTWKLREGPTLQRTVVLDRAPLHFHVNLEGSLRP